MSDSLIDNFFVDDADPGVAISVEFQGKKLPFTIRRGITVGQKEAITQAAVQRHLDLDTGRIVIDGMSEAKLEAGIVHAYLLSWPSSRPLTLENIAKLDSVLLESIFIQIQRGRTATEEEADGPFVPASAEDSVAPAQEASASAPVASPSASPATSDSAGSLTPSDA